MQRAARLADPAPLAVFGLASLEGTTSHYTSHYTLHYTAPRSTAPHHRATAPRRYTTAPPPHRRHPSPAVVTG